MSFSSALEVNISLARCPLLVMPSGMGQGNGPQPRGVQALFPAGQHILLGLRFQELSWDHTSPEEEESVLWLEFDGDNEGTPVNKLLKIYSKQVGVGAACIPGMGMERVDLGASGYWRSQPG